MEKLYLKTVSRDLLEGKDHRYDAVSFFNFENGTRKIGFDKKHRDTVMTQGTTWIRVHLKDGNSYDFVTSSLTAFIVDDAMIVMCNDDAEFIDANYIAKLVNEFQIKTKGTSGAGTQGQDLNRFYKYITENTKKVAAEMEGLYLVSKQMSSSRLNIQDSYEYGKQQLEKNNVLNLLIRQVVKENREAILNLI